jgi:pimeloyl-ACP methyl ester carboxylesterase
VTPVNMATGRAEAPITVEDDPLALAVTPNGRTLYVANGADNNVTVVRAAKLTPGGHPGWPKRPRDHGHMRVTRGDGSVIAVEVAGDPDGVPVLLCHGLADSRLSAHGLRPAALELGLRIIAPDRPGTGGTDLRRLRRVVDWVQDAALVLDRLQVGSAALLGISGGGPFAAACAAAISGRVSSLTLIAPLGAPAWPADGMAPGERLSLRVAGQAPDFGGWFLGRLAALARSNPRLFLRIAASELPDSDRRAIGQSGLRDAFVANYTEAFRRGSQGVAQDLRLLTRPWGFRLDAIKVPTTIHHGDADNTVPLQHGRGYAAAIPGAQLRVHPGHGHFSIVGAMREILAPLAGSGRPR